MSNSASFEVGPPYIYECTDCGERIEADSSIGQRPECEGEMRNLSKSSGQ
ncbi:rubrerythrin-like domain-containing protein [Halogeometricum pallidum]|nr:rubrerythrin-like domain-containing protein [Halogeometricum pallidum]